MVLGRMAVKKISMTVSQAVQMPAQLGDLSVMLRQGGTQMRKRPDCAHCYTEAFFSFQIPVQNIVPGTLEPDEDWVLLSTVTQDASHSKRAQKVHI